jgi:AraC-like DNA-binding protein
LDYFEHSKIRRAGMNHLKGKQIGLPLLAEAGIAHTQIAQRITWHSHGGYQLLFLLSGATTYEFRNVSEKRLDLSGEHFAIIPPGAVHRGVRDMRPPCDLFFLIIESELSEPSRNSPFTTADWQWIEQHFRRAPIIALSLSPELRRAVTVLAREVQKFSNASPAPLTQALLRTHVCEVLLEAARQLTNTSDATPDAIVVAAEKYLRENMEEQFRMSDVADQLGVSRARLFDAFKRGTGMTPNDYLLRVRIEKAKELLTKPSRQVTEIAFETGFASSQYFSTVFRKYTGQTPKEYRLGISKPSKAA